jgi:hypothetical protein
MDSYRLPVSTQHLSQQDILAIASSTDIQTSTVKIFSISPINIQSSVGWVKGHEIQRRILVLGLALLPLASKSVTALPIGDRAGLHRRSKHPVRIIRSIT